VEPRERMSVAAKQVARSTGSGHHDQAEDVLADA
jgi:hypothetical protein